MSALLTPIIASIIDAPAEGILDSAFLPIQPPAAWVATLRNLPVNDGQLNMSYRGIVTIDTGWFMNHWSVLNGYRQATLEGMLGINLFGNPMNQESLAALVSSVAAVVQSNGWGFGELNIAGPGMPPLLPSSDRFKMSFAGTEANIIFVYDDLSGVWLESGGSSAYVLYDSVAPRWELYNTDGLLGFYDAAFPQPTHPWEMDYAHWNATTSGYIPSAFTRVNASLELLIEHGWTLTLP